MTDERAALSFTSLAACAAAVVFVTLAIVGIGTCDETAIITSMVVDVQCNHSDTTASSVVVTGPGDNGRHLEFHQCESVTVRVVGYSYSDVAEHGVAR